MSSSMTTSTPKTTVGDETLFDVSYQRVLPEIEALAAEDCLDVNLDIPTAVATALGVLPQLNGFRSTIAKELPGFDLGRFDRLEDYTLALSHANAKHATATRAPDGLAELNDEGLKLRATLHGDLLALAGRGLVQEAAIKNYSGDIGPKNIAADLQIQAQVLKDNWDRVEGKCATTSAEVERALKVAVHLLRLAGLKEQSPAVLASATEVRLRAFTLFSQAYDDARRAIMFLRWHENDADAIAPSLYAGRGGSRKKPAADTAPAPTATTTTDAAATASATSDSTQNDASKAAANPSKAPTNPFMP